MNASPSPQPPLWHVLSTEQVLQALDTAPGGLSRAKPPGGWRSTAPTGCVPPNSAGRCCASCSSSTTC